jgi:hypothetical protein
MSVFVDRSVWVGYFKQRNDHLVALLSEKTLIWTLDKKFELLAVELNKAYLPKLHS